MSIFENVEQAPPIEGFTLNKICVDDEFGKKVNCGIGVYRTNEGKPWVLPVVRDVELAMAKNDSLNHEYLPVLGMEEFCTAASTLLLGQDSDIIKQKRFLGIQTLSGVGALRVGAEFLSKILKCDTFYLSNPTYENHHLIYSRAGFNKFMEYRYWDSETKRIDFNGLIEDLSNAKPNSVIVLHACAHNPTGLDPSKDQWKKIADVITKKKLITFFDIAYQGFATGDLEADAWPVRYFASLGLELLCAQSFAKNFGLYNERIGNLTLVVSNPDVISRVKSQMTLIVRSMYSNPPNHGARIVATILNDPVLRSKWIDCIKTMSGRIKEMRTLLRESLEKKGASGQWDHVTSQIGMFSFTGLSEQQVEHLRKRYHIYLLKNGRMSVAGLNTSNIEYVADAITETLKEIH